MKKTGRGRDTAERRRSPERSGQMFRGGPRHCRGTTAQELVEDFSAALISSF